MAWDDSMTPGSACPWGCNAGYYMRAILGIPWCEACPTGKYSTRGSQTACSTCDTVAIANAYAVAPSVTGECHWDCNAGFHRADPNALACLACPDSSFCTQRRTTSTQALNAPTPCTQCVSGQQYETRACAATQDRQCAPCRSCALGQYQSAACTPTQNRACTACRTACDAGYYLSALAAEACRGDLSTADPVACFQCASPDACAQAVAGAAGRYMRDTCGHGDTTVDRVCAVCANPDCTSDQYLVGCQGFQDRACADIPLCPAGQYRAGVTLADPGVCTSCTDCALVPGATNVVRACARCVFTGHAGSPLAN